MGEDLEPGTRIRLLIEGLENRFAAAELVVDPAGHFTHDVPLPPALTAGVYGVKAEAGGELVASDVLVIADGADPGVPIDRSPPWLAIAGIGFAVVALLVLLRAWGRRGRANGAPLPTTDPPSAANEH